MATIQAAQNQKHTNTEGLAKPLKLKFGMEVMLAVNIATQDWLFIDITGNIRVTEFGQGGVRKVYVTGICIW